MSALLRRLRRLLDWRAAAVDEWDHRRGAEAMLSRHAADRSDTFARDLGRGPSPLRDRDPIQGDTWEGL